MGKSSWKRRVKETATTQNSGSSGGDGGWSFMFDYKSALESLDFIHNGNGELIGDKPLKCVKNADEQCQCIAIEGKFKGSRRVVRLDDIENMDDEDFKKFKNRLLNFKMDKGLCWSMHCAFTRRCSTFELTYNVCKCMQSQKPHAKCHYKKKDQSQTKKATKDSQTPPQESKSTQRNEKKKRPKKPNQLTPEEIAVKAAEGMKRRAKKKPQPYDPSQPANRPIQEVPWFQEVLRRNGKSSCDDKAVLAAANMAENFRGQFIRGPVTLRQFTNLTEWLHFSLKLAKQEVACEDVAQYEYLLDKESPFWTKKNMMMIRGLVAAGFTLKHKGAEGAAVGGEASH